VDSHNDGEAEMTRALLILAALAVFLTSCGHAPGKNVPVVHATDGSGGPTYWYAVVDPLGTPLAVHPFGTTLDDAVDVAARQPGEVELHEVPAGTSASDVTNPLRRNAIDAKFVIAHQTGLSDDSRARLANIIRRAEGPGGHIRRADYETVPKLTPVQPTQPPPTPPSPDLSSAYSALSPRNGVIVGLFFLAAAALVVFIRARKDSRVAPVLIGALTLLFVLVASVSAADMTPAYIWSALRQSADDARIILDRQADLTPEVSARLLAIERRALPPPQP
jgi:hypothetical protein